MYISQILHWSFLVKRRNWWAVRSCQQPGLLSRFCPVLLIFCLQNRETWYLLFHKLYVDFGNWGGALPPSTEINTCIPSRTGRNPALEEAMGTVSAIAIGERYFLSRWLYFKTYSSSDIIVNLNTGQSYLIFLGTVKEEYCKEIVWLANK